MIKVEITEGNGKTWVDPMWVEAPNEEECIKEYNPGCLIRVIEGDEEIDIFET